MHLMQFSLECTVKINHISMLIRIETFFSRALHVPMLFFASFECYDSLDIYLWKKKEFN